MSELFIIKDDKRKNYTLIGNSLLRDQRLSMKAIGLMAKILSLPLVWDFSVAGLAAICKEKSGSINSILKELEQYGYYERKQIRGKNGQFEKTIYFFYEKPKNVDMPEVVKPEVENLQTVNPNSEKAAQSITNSNQLSKEKNTYPIKSDMESDTVDFEGYKIYFHYLFQDSMLRGRYSDQELDELESILVDTMCSKKLTIRVACENKPSELVKSVLMKLEPEHISYVLDSFRDNPTDIKNMRQYILTSLFNAPQTMSLYYQNLARKNNS